MNILLSRFLWLIYICLCLLFVSLDLVYAINPIVSKVEQRKRKQKAQSIEARRKKIIDKQYVASQYCDIINISFKGIIPNEDYNCYSVGRWAEYVIIVSFVSPDITMAFDNIPIDSWDNIKILISDDDQKRIVTHTKNKEQKPYLVDIYLPKHQVGLVTEWLTNPCNTGLTL